VPHRVVDRRAWNLNDNTISLDMNDAIDVPREVFALLTSLGFHWEQIDWQYLIVEAPVGIVDSRLLCNSRTQGESLIFAKCQIRFSMASAFRKHHVDSHARCTSCRR